MCLQITVNYGNCMSIYTKQRSSYFSKGPIFRRIFFYNGITIENNKPFCCFALFYQEVKKLTCYFLKYLAEQVSNALYGV